MARLTEYTDERKAQVYVYWLENDQNTYGTSKDLGIPLSTMKAWKRKWVAGDTPDVDPDAFKLEADVFLTELEDVRMLAIRQIRKLIPDTTEKQLSPLITIVKEITDKIDRVAGLPNTRQEVVHVDSTVVKKQLNDFFDELRRSSEQREADITLDSEDIVDATIVEHAPRELDPAKE